ncbi:polysaccharide deacetylase family protein [Amycolatopsis sp. GM8]|uniref:polysaccharide deacetylase family protein n=1 Tax=Amycolatopsis sp. GM8 TaxID=2896530 RepID=UPI001F01F67C|nr:polysaccharide deacetylase family protein [Amycolatopsis sp. GM8]
MRDTSAADLRPREFAGYGGRPPSFRWPGGARVAINLAINYEEGTERNPLHGDTERDSRTWVRSALPPSERDLMQEGEYEYGTRAGIWRLLRAFRQYNAPFSMFVSSTALPLNPPLLAQLAEEDCDFVAHGTRSISHPDWTEDEERADLRACVDQVWGLTGQQILGAFPRPPITVRTRRLMAEEGLLYDSATTNDDIPYYTPVLGRPMLVVPYAVDTNDARFWGGHSGPGYIGPADFFDYLKGSFDVLRTETDDTARLMSVGLHARIMRPGRIAALYRFLDYVSGFPDVWIAKRNDIARHFAGLFAPPDAWNWPPVSPPAPTLPD